MARYQSVGMFTQALSLVAFSAITVSGRFVSTGASVQLNDVHYFIPPFSQGQIYDPLELRKYSNASTFVPVSIVAQPCTEDELHDLFANWTSQDDVWQPGFLETVFLATSDDSGSPMQKIYLGDTASTVLRLQEPSTPSGPYFLAPWTGEIYQAYRLYEDFAGAFTQSLLQGPDKTFQTLSAQVPSSGSLTIGVPSRLYFTPSKKQPLAGIRIGVKDIYALAGTKRSNGNRAWYSLYPPANETGTAMQNLLDAGAVIVGLQKPSQFANGETATADWVDFHAPFNPRGDGYQDPSSSSAGAGASVASYEWLDLAVGSDTGGSIRGPAGAQGLFGNRPTHGLVSLDNVMPLSPRLDTAGFLTRDPKLWDTANAALYASNYTSFADKSPKYPQKLYLLDFPTTNDSTARMRRKFASDLASFLNTTTSTLELEKEWAASGPASLRAHNISEVLNLTYTTLITKQQTKLLRDPFYEDYSAVHDGRRPFIDPIPLTRWGWADTQPDSILDDAIANKTRFMNWFNEKILPPVDDPLTCSSGFLLHTVSTGYAHSRNEYLSPSGPPFGFSNSAISGMTENPDSVFPLGQVSSFSPITNHTELLPVTVDVIAARGCDGLIAKLARDLVDAGILVAPRTGSGLNGGTILLRRDEEE
ncbi:centractin- actin- protein of the dynactin complex [Penicillium chermesinum]|uniref:Centractin- actin- protein of the dynactin complex n=1 Tax=Penicillium chermesinum TaxID=63820 RepID=A0A9W9NZZ0_9EURO|nr:centractin- actin- protein of the dynactin complex [Penicillium chermesinum]KAJ5232560.1 centractin- actin- protein of the dynactin complex [Penicillium chermesinum]